ncbi:hypothetical protein N825_31890 [Skermanella stibiiresistens SB22]|uniref:DUF4810 domain-containing protein n=1 Tax=Skermanella stibiiresistens SB22 TaxID=1385369 RepID=W9GTL4_9PROT|nr:DUF4810 domain-containing protein [Skermanella stibiiresistens]EWY36026.1 hypothetical protein N825_31890 [Skermanella stibiiresistens SB22]
MTSRYLPPLLAAILCVGCAPATKYHWGDYSSSLYDYHRDPTAQAGYRKSLERILASGEPEKRVPPGIYAELGYLKLSSGDTAGAVALFEKEKAVWPESAVMMDKTILSTRANKDKTPSDGGATPVSAPTS